MIKFDLRCDVVTCVDEGITGQLICGSLNMIGQSSGTGGS
jgi:hypothetical protein